MFNLILMQVILSIPSYSLSIRSIPDTKTPPTRRQDSALAYDSQLNSLFIYGGFEDTNEYFDDMWRFDLNSNTWEEVLSPSPVLPGPRANSYMQVLSNRRFLILFGGSTPHGPICDLWLFDMDNYIVLFN